VQRGRCGDDQKSAKGACKRGSEECDVPPNPTPIQSQAFLRGQEQRKKKRERRRLQDSIVQFTLLWVSLGKATKKCDGALRGQINGYPAMEIVFRLSILEM